MTLTHDDPTSIEPDDLFWQAVRYVSDDLSADDAERFEQRLATDPRACEAVAHAVRLLSGIHSAESLAPQLAPASPACAPNRPAARNWWPVVVSTAIVLLIAVFATSRQAFDPPAAEIASAELLNRWRLEGRFSGADDLEFDDHWDGEAEVVDESLSPPDWLLSAVKLADDSRPVHP